MLRYAILLLACAGAVATAAPTFYTPGSSYTSASGSPFAGIPFTWYYLNDFETNSAAATPGVSASSGNTSLNSGFSGAIVDSVDDDDGSVNGSCAKSNGTCISWFANGSPGVTWSFDAGVLGALPTHAGIVWTDGFGTVTFTAFGPGMVLLGSVTNANGGWVPGGNFADQDVSEDHFFGVSDPAGILAIQITNSSGGIEMDHLQYGLVSDSAIPEPSSVMLIGGGVSALAFLRRRRA